MYLDHDTMDQKTIDEQVARLSPVVDEFMPLTDRAVFISKKDVHTEVVYNYDRASAIPSRYILSAYSDVLTTIFNETILNVNEDFTDHLA